MRPIFIVPEPEVFSRQGDRFEHIQSQDRVLQWAYPTRRLGWPAPESSVAGTLQRAFETAEGADLYILCGGKEILAHRAMVCSWSEVLKGLCKQTGDHNKETFLGEMSGYILDSENEEPLAVETMIWFCYFGNYPYFDEDGEDGYHDKLRFSLHARVYAFATKYKIFPLRRLAARLFHKAMKHFRDFSLFVDCIPTVYGAEPKTDRGLRDLVVKRIHRFTLARIMSDDRDRTRFTRLFERCPHFTTDILTAMYPQPKTKPVTEREKPNDLPQPDVGGAIYSEIWKVTDQNGVSYDAILPLTTPRDERNKFCRFQILESEAFGPYEDRHYRVWARFGIVEDTGGGSDLYYRGVDGLTRWECNLQCAMIIFKRQFQVRTGVEWENRLGEVVKGKYTFIRDNFWGINNFTAKPFLFDMTSVETLAECLERRNAAQAAKSPKCPRAPKTPNQRLHQNGQQSRKMASKRGKVPEWEDWS